MEKKNKTIVIGIVMTLFLISSVFAMSTYQNVISNDITDLGSKINYGFTHGFLLFSAWGQANGCSVNPDWSGVITQGQSVSCSGTCAIDSWLEQYMGSTPLGVLWQFYLGETNGKGASFTCTYNFCYVERYNCPTQTSSTPTTKTNVFKCVNGNFVNEGTFGYSDTCSYSSEGTCWCAGTNNFYIDKNNGEHCQSSSYSSVTDGTWCPSSNSNTQTSTSTSSKGDIRLNGKVNVVNPILTFDTPVPIKIPLKNFGSATETINVEAGFYSSQYATKTAQLYSIFNLFSAVSIPNCNPAENFVGTQQVTLDPGKTTTVEIDVVPSYAFVTYPIGTNNLKTNPLVWFAGIYKECLGGYINDAGTTGKGVVFDYGTFNTNCQFSVAGLGDANIYCDGTAIGTCKRGLTTGDVLKLTSACNITSTISVVNGTTASQSVVSTSTSDFLNTYFGWAGFFDVNGDGQKDGTDGAIIAGGVLVLLFIVSSLGRKK